MNECLNGWIKEGNREASMETRKQGINERRKQFRKEARHN